MFKRNPKYPDILFFLILIPISSGINYHLTYSNIKFDWFFIITFIIDTLTGYVAWLAIRRVVFALDKHYPFDQQLTKRILLQIVTTILVGFIIIAGITEIASLIYKGELAPISFYTKDMVIISIWLFGLSGVYISMHFYYEYQSLKERDIKHATTSTFLIAKHGKKSYQIDPNEIRYFKKQGDYVIAYQYEDQKFLLDHSLDQLERMIDLSNFFRINRQCILRKDQILGYDRLDYGKLLVIPQSELAVLGDEVISRNKAPDFKQWFHAQHEVVSS